MSSACQPRLKDTAGRAVGHRILASQTRPTSQLSQALSLSTPKGAAARGGGADDTQPSRGQEPQGPEGRGPGLAQPAPARPSARAHGLLGNFLFGGEIYKEQEENASDEKEKMHLSSLGLR